jgi:hypothetical protein
MLDRIGGAACSTWSRRWLDVHAEWSDGGTGVDRAGAAAAGGRWWRWWGFGWLVGVRGWFSDRGDDGRTSATCWTSYNLEWDPREEHPVDFPHAWMLHPVAAAAGAFLKTLVVEPPIKPGTHDPYVPPEPVSCFRRRTCRSAP